MSDNNATARAIILEAPMRPPCGRIPELWFSTHKDERDRAAAICQDCPLRQPCARHAIEVVATSERRHVEGVWAGVHLTAHESKTTQTNRLATVITQEKHAP